MHPRNMPSNIVNMPAHGQIDREEFFLHLKTWKEGERQCRIHISGLDGEPLIDIVKAELVDINTKTGEVKIRCGEEDWVFNLSSADQFRYFNYDDPDEKMQ
jgi:hypothetical protein